MKIRKRTKNKTKKEQKELNEFENKIYYNMENIILAS